MKHPFFSRNSLIIKFFVYTGLLMLVGCDQASTSDRESPTSGTIHISVDESFQPVFDEQISIFHSQYPKAKVIVEYKPEAECLRDLFEDSTRLVIVTRKLTSDEEKFFKNKLSYVPRQAKLVLDAVTVIVNNQSVDSMFTMEELREILSGSSPLKLRPVMDGNTATSTVRFAIDSVLQGRPLGKNVTAARSSKGVINYVAENPDAIGFIGVSWIGNKEDTAQLSFLKRVKVASIECTNCDSGLYVKPYQEHIAFRRYPMVRSLYYIVKEGFDGLGSGFVNFLQYERGQLIFRRAYLWPVRMSFQVREVQL